MTVRVEPDPAFAAGHARMVVPGGAAGLGGPGLRIQRDEDWGDDKLGPQGWQSTEAVLVPDRAEARGADLVLHLGWAVCQYLEAGPYSVWVPGAGVEGVTVAWPDITPLHGGTVSMFAVGQAAETVRWCRWRRCRTWCRARVRDPVRDRGGCWRCWVCWCCSRRGVVGPGGCMAGPSRWRRRRPRPPLRLLRRRLWLLRR